jgi:hypothetical protein
MLDPELLEAAVDRALGQPRADKTERDGRLRQIDRDLALLATRAHRPYRILQASRLGCPPARWWGGRHGDAEIADQAEEIRPLEAEDPGGVRAVSASLVERRFDEPSLEVVDRAVIAGRAITAWRDERGRFRHGAHARTPPQRVCQRLKHSRCGLFGRAT